MILPFNVHFAKRKFRHSIPNIGVKSGIERHPGSLAKGLLR